MKLHLPTSLLMAVVCAMNVAAESGTYSYDGATDANNDDIFDGKVTFTGTGDLSGINIYHSDYGAGVIGALPKNGPDGNVPDIHTAPSSEIILKDAIVNKIAVSGVCGYAVSGDKSLTIDNTTVNNFIYAGYMDSNRGGVQLFDKPSWEGHSHFAPQSAPNSTIAINVRNNSKVDAIYGSSYYTSTRLDDLKSNFFEEGKTTVDYEWTPITSTDAVNITVSDSTVTNGIYGSMSGCVIDNKVTITVNDTEGDGIDTKVGFIMAGGQSYTGVRTCIKSTHVIINGGTVSGNIFGGSNSSYGGGVVKEGTRIDINGGIVAADAGKIVCGGSGTGGEIFGGTEININGGIVKNSIYGGGRGLAVYGGTEINLSGGVVESNIYAAGDGDTVYGGTKVVIKDGGTEVQGVIAGSGTNEAKVEGDRSLTIDSSYTGEHSYKVADFTDIVVNADVTLAQLTAAAEGTAIEIADDAKLTVEGAETTVSSGNVTGGTLCLDGSTFELADAESVLTSKVEMLNHATLDLKGATVTSSIVVYGCTLKGGANYEGDMIVSGDLTLTEATKADSLTLSGAGSVSGASLNTDTITVKEGHTGQISSDLILGDNSTITLESGTKLVVTGSLTLGNGIRVVVDESFKEGDVVIEHEEQSTDKIDEELTLVTTSGQEVAFVLTDNAVIIDFTPYDQHTVDVLTQANWGVAMASRAFVNAVQSQRNNMGCIANGKGTAWAGALFGDYSLDNSGAKAGSDTTMYGAAVGADMKVGEQSILGIALGATDTEISLDNESDDIDQDGAYVAVYGEHGLKKLSDTSCLSLNWVAAYGNTESSYQGVEWDQDHVQLNTRLNWNKKVTDRLGVTAFGGLEYFASESGSTPTGKSGSVQNLRGEIGMGVSYVAWGIPASAPVTDEKGAPLAAARPGCEKLILHGEISYMNDMVRNNPVITHYDNRGSGANPGRQGMGIKAGATYKFGNRWSASANYSFNAMDDANEHNVNVGASYTF